MFFPGIHIEVFFHNDTTDALDELELESKLNSYDLKTVTLYNIEGLTPYIDYNDEDKEYCCILCNGTRFISPLTMNKVEAIISKHMRDIMYRHSAS